MSGSGSLEMSGSRLRAGCGGACCGITASPEPDHESALTETVIETRQKSFRNAVTVLSIWLTSKKVRPDALRAFLSELR
jgi:hypothetical protein